MSPKGAKVRIKMLRAIRDGYFFATCREYRIHGILYNYRLYNKHGREIKSTAKGNRKMLCYLFPRKGARPKMENKRRLFAYSAQPVARMRRTVTANPRLLLICVQRAWARFGARCARVSFSFLIDFKNLTPPQSKTLPRGLSFYMGFWPSAEAVKPQRCPTRLSGALPAHKLGPPRGCLTSS